MSGKMTDADRARQFVTYYAEGALPFDYREKMVVALTHAALRPQRRSRVSPAPRAPGRTRRCGNSARVPK
jgi:hypothetical protein